MNIKIPYRYTPRDYQLDFLKSPARFKIGVWHRRAGKTKTILNDQIAKTQIKKGIYYYFLPTYRQAKSVIWDELISLHLPKDIYLKKNDSELAIYYKNGSIQRFAGCEDIDKHRGINPIDVVFDEFAEMKEEIWTTVIQPVLRENKGSATFIFTPHGKNHAWKMIQRNHDRKDWLFSLKTVKDTKAVSDEELEAAKADMPEDLFNQEWNCDFLDNAGQVFRRVKECIEEETPNLAELKNLVFQIGVDLAKHRDWTVITPFCLNNFKVYPQERFNQIDYNLQKAKIEATYLRYNRGKIIIDSTGVGEPVFDDLANANIKIEPFYFTYESRRQLLTNLQILIEQNKIQIPNDKGLIDELESMQYDTTTAGRTKMQVPNGCTDDRIMSLALAAWKAVKLPTISGNQENGQTEYLRYLQSVRR